MQECIAECQECHSSCLALVNHCLELDGSHADPAHVGLLADCAEICQTSANFMLVCRACAEDCARMARG